MAIEDSDPERRNLVVTSIAFIIFYLADAEMSTDAITLQVLPVKFHNVLALIIFAWIMLLWFLVRYWQTHRQSYKNSYLSYLTEFNQGTHRAEAYLKSALKLFPFNENGNFNKGGFTEPSFFRGAQDKLHIRYKVVEEFTKNGDSSISIGSPLSKSEPLKGFDGFLIRSKYFFSFAIESPGFTSFAMPYVFFMMAILLPALKAHNFIS